MMVAAVLVTQWSTIILYHWRHLHELLFFSIAIYLLLFCIVQLFILLDLWCAVSPYFGFLSLFFTWSVQLVRVWKLNSIKFYLKCTCNSSVYSAIWTPPLRFQSLAWFYFLVLVMTLQVIKDTWVMKRLTMWWGTWETCKMENSESEFIAARVSFAGS